MLESIESAFREKVCNEISLLKEGNDRYIVLNPFYFSDGDHPLIVLQKRGQQWMLTDEGSTFMRLTYDIPERDLESGTRQSLISDMLSVYGMKSVSGVLQMNISNDDFGNALYSFVQAVIRISDVTYLSRERIKSTFIEDFKAFISQQFESKLIEFDWFYSAQDPKGNYVSDCRINGRSTPFMVFALSNDDKVQAATITIHQYEKWGIPFKSVGIFENQEEINRKVLARFSDVCEKQFSSLGAKDRIRNYIQA